MSRFRAAEEPPIPFSEIRPERFDPMRLLDDLTDERRQRRIDEMRRVFMEEIPLPAEIERDRPRQKRGNR